MTGIYRKIKRKTKVVSVSLPPKTAIKLERASRAYGQSRSAFVAALIEKEAEDRRWQRIYRRGQETAGNFRITSEDDVDRIIHAS